jgi:hypothetical protein
MNEWFDVALPFPCEPIPEQDLAFGEIVRNGRVANPKGQIATVQVHRDTVGHIGLHQSWATPLGHEENTRALKRMVAEGKLQGMTEAAIDNRKRNDPHVRLTVTLPEEINTEMSWWWFGDGSYDTFGADTPVGQSLPELEA